jgi:hypothetical protein
MNRVGRKSGIPRSIAGLHFKLSTLSSAATDQFKPPSRTPDARHRQGSRRKRADAPAGDSYRWLAESTGLRLQAAHGDARGDASGVPAALTQHFECVTWPLATAVAGRRQEARDVRIDIGTKMRGMWR